MRGWVYQIEPASIMPEKRVASSAFDEHWFTREIADYVSDDVNRDQVIRALREQLERSKTVAFLSDDTFTILKGGQKAYFKEAFKLFKAARDRTIGMTLWDFATTGKFTEIMRQMNDAYSESFSDYVCSAEDDESYEEVGRVSLGEITTLDEFIRRAEVGETYHIGGVVDYHA